MIYKLEARKFLYIFSLAALLASVQPNVNAQSFVSGGIGNDQEALFGSIDRSAVEAVSDFSNSSKYRKFSEPVGMLLIEFKVGDPTFPIATPVATCTGSLVTREHVLTAEHCLRLSETFLGDYTGEQVSRGNIYFLLDYLVVPESGPSVTRHRVETIVEENALLDFAILKLRAKVHPDREIAQIDTSLPGIREELFIVHHPLRLEKQVTRRFCRTHTADMPRLNYQCHTEEGSSGAPIFSDNTFSREPSSQPKIIAIHSGADHFLGHNYGVMVSCVIGASNFLKELYGVVSPACLDSSEDSSIAGH